MSNSKANTGQINEAWGPWAVSLTCLVPLQDTSQMLVIKDFVCLMQSSKLKVNRQEAWSGYLH